MDTQLKPTLWRTARALANKDRLNLMRLVSTANGTKGVVELAEEAVLPVPTASLYLRALNARGLISVVRSGPYVFYGTGPDRSLPVAVRIQNTFRRLFAASDLPDDWAQELLPTLRAYSNARRESIVRRLRASQPIRFIEFMNLCGLCETTFLRHLSILVAAGVVTHDREGFYSLAKPKTPLAAEFLKAACS